MVYNVIQQTFPDGSHRWKYFNFGMSVGDIREYSVISSDSIPGEHVKRKEFENAKRAKQRIYELAKSNTSAWEYFVTLTFDPKRISRQNYNSCYSAVRTLCKQLGSHGSTYLFVPELHRDGVSYHFHGLVGGWIPIVYSGHGGPVGSPSAVYNLKEFPGFTTVLPVRDSSRVATYITKYITKELVATVPKGCHRYLRSQNLKEPTVSYLSMTEVEFCAMLNYGEYFEPSRFEEGLESARFVKKIPMYYQGTGKYMYIVED